MAKSKATIPQQVDAEMVCPPGVDPDAYLDYVEAKKGKDKTGVYMSNQPQQYKEAHKMPKKSFKEQIDNPALQFITTPGDEQNKADKAEPAAPSEAKHPLKTGSTIQPHATGGEERKSRRLNLLLQPSIVSDLEKVATMKQTSLNDLINTILKESLASETESINKYNKTFGGKAK